MYFLAYETRKNMMVGFTENTALNILSEKAESIKTSTDTLEILKQAIDLNLLQITSDKRLSFSHEMYQEYFCAEELLYLYETEKDLIEVLQENPDWEEPLILFSGLSTNSNDLTINIAEKDPHLAVKCIESSIKDDPVINQKVIDTTLNNLTFKRVDGSENYKKLYKALIALVKLDDYDSFGSVLTDIKGEDEFKLNPVSILGKILRLVAETTVIQNMKIYQSLNDISLPETIKYNVKRYKFTGSKERLKNRILKRILTIISGKIKQIGEGPGLSNYNRDEILYLLDFLYQQRLSVS